MTRKRVGPVAGSIRSNGVPRKGGAQGWTEKTMATLIKIMALLLLLTLTTPASPMDRREMDWGDLTVAQEILRREGYRGLAVIRGSLKPKRNSVEMKVEAVAPGGLVLEIVLELEGGDVLGEGE